jgi:hypothetical protein
MKRYTHAEYCRARPAGRALLTLAMLVVSPAVFAQDKKPRLPSAEKVLDKTIEAQGGREAFENLTNCVKKGKLVFEVQNRKLQGTIESYRAFPDLVRTTVKLNNQNYESGSDGFVYWAVNPQGVTIYEGDEKADRERSSRFNDQLHWRQLYEKVECVGKEVVDGHKCVKIILTPPTGKPVVAYYDWKKGLPLGTDETQTTEQGERVQEDRLSDYREVNGVQVPFKVVRVIKIGGQVAQTITYTYDSIEYNVDIPADKFELPAQVKKEAE